MKVRQFLVLSVSTIAAVSWGVGQVAAQSTADTQ